jgi:hypothetical protein
MFWNLKKGPESSNSSDHTITQGLFCQRLDSVNESVSGVDIDTGIAVREALGFCRVSHDGSFWKSGKRRKNGVLWI